MQINLEQQGTVQVLHCSGSLDADTVSAFKKLAYDLVGKGTKRFVIDCADLTFIDSMGLGVLISLLRRVRQQEGDVKVAGLSDEVKTIFEITRLHRLFEVCSDWNAAVNDFDTK